jgi:hypothetical protein
MDIISNLQQTIDETNRALAMARWYAVVSVALLVFVAVKVSRE